MSSMIEDIAANHPLLKYQLKKIKAVAKDEDEQLRARLDGHLAALCQYYDIDAAEAAEMYMAFVTLYSKDLKHYEKTGEYPMESSEGPSQQVDRKTYDVFLVASCLLTTHRFAIMRNLEKDLSHGPDRVLVVGVGVGVELAVIDGRAGTAEAYDLEIGDFVIDAFPNVDFKQKEFTGQKDARYDVALAIELLEHVEEPGKLLRDMRRSMAAEGVCLVTTATNVPQFDHCINFDDEDAFLSELAGCGFQVEQAEHIPHEYMLSGVEASNTYYSLRPDPSSAE